MLRGRIRELGASAVAISPIFQSVGFAQTSSFCTTSLWQLTGAVLSMVWHVAAMLRLSVATYCIRENKLVTAVVPHMLDEVPQEADVLGSETCLIERHHRTSHCACLDLKVGATPVVQASECLAPVSLHLLQQGSWRNLAG